MLEVYYWHFAFVLIGKLSNVIKGDIHFLECKERNDVSFECPCPEEFNECRFKKLFQGGYIVRDGVLNHRYQLNDKETHITLKECNEDDEGTYVWMCGKCNVNGQFHLKVQKAVSGGNSKLLKCIEGSNVSFECPCCSEEFNDCRFKKLFQGGYIVRDGALSSDNHHYQSRYQFNDNKTHITLKECNEDDVGTYVWMCGKSNVNKYYDLEVHKLSGKILVCSVGGKIYFECPCCAEELDSCRFKKLKQEGYIVRGGVLSVRHPRFEFDEHKTHITLEECNEDDEGTYVWMCGRCNVNKHFHLRVLHNPFQVPPEEFLQNQSVTVRVSVILLIPMFFVLKIFA